MNPLVKVTVVLLAVLAGCAETQHSDLREWMKEQGKTLRGKVPPLPEVKPFPPIAYKGRDAAAPFSAKKIVTIESASEQQKLDLDRPRQHLENFPLEDLRVTGVIIKDGQGVAMIAPPAPQKPKPIRVGEYMGQNFGRVLSITTEAVTVLETAKDSGGAWIEREVVKEVPRQGAKK